MRSCNASTGDLAFGTHCVDLAMDLPITDPVFHPGEQINGRAGLSHSFNYLVMVSNCRRNSRDFDENAVHNSDTIKRKPKTVTGIGHVSYLSWYRNAVLFRMNLSSTKNTREARWEYRWRQGSGALPRSCRGLGSRWLELGVLGRFYILNSTKSTKKRKVSLRKRGQYGQFSSENGRPCVHRKGDNWSERN